MNPTVAVAAVIAFEDVGDRPPHIAIFVSDPQLGPLIKIGTASKAQPGQKGWQRMGLSQGINQQGLLPVRQELQVDTQAFFFSSSLAFLKRSCSSCKFRTSRRSDSSCRSSSARWGSDGRSAWRFIDAGTSRQSS